MAFIQVTALDGKRVLVNLSDVQRVIEEADGCFIVTFEGRKSLCGFYVQEDYYTVMLRIENARSIG